jgi:Zn-dependent M28 family amino/carboxypeptidase
MRCLRARQSLLLLACILAMGSWACKGAPTSQAAPIPPPPAPPPSAMGGFDGQRSYQQVANLVAIGPRSAGSEGDLRAQQYILRQLQSFGCPVDQDHFHASTPIGNVAMDNIVAEIPGSSRQILLLATHYDTKQLPDFVGADDGGSSTGVMLEMARLLCSRKNAMDIWIAFFDGEEAFRQWSDTDGTYGSREMAARLALSGDLPRVQAMLLADIVGTRNLVIKRESNSTPWLTKLVWSTAARLGYQNIFVPALTTIEDDHIPFLRRNVPAVDIIDLEIPYWHTPEDTLDKISPRSLAIVGHVLMETVGELEQKFHPAGSS